RLFEETLEVLHDMGEPPPSATIIFDSYSRLLCVQGRYALAREVAQMCQELSRDANHWATAAALVTLGQIALAQGELDEAEARYLDGMARFEAQGAPGGAAFATVGIANLHRARGAYAEARAAIARYLAMDDAETVNEAVRARAYRHLGDVERAQGNQAAAAEAYHTSLQLVSGIAYVVEVLECLERVGWLTTSTAPAAAATILGAAARLRRQTGMALAPIDQPAHELALHELRGCLPELLFRQSWNAGEALDWPEASAVARDELLRAMGDGEA
ncbi:MAG TPA: tetratricopeptide repeat protein, partial [Chloroflexota bacterium]|nr:tetratricopeptide repeat protein [Chloroflexota bacterium]